VERAVVVISPGHGEVRDHLDGRCDVVFQDPPRGTGHAVAQVPAELLGAGDVLVLNGDQPLIRPETVARVLAAHREAGAAATLTSVHDAGRPDGRVIRDGDGSFVKIVEHRDATPAERACDEINVGVYCFRGPELVEALARLEPTNAQGEYYLTDVFSTLRPVAVVELEDAGEALGINNRVQLADAEAVLRRRVLERLMLSGVTVVDPASTYVDAGVEVGRDTVLEPFTFLRGSTVIGEGCRIGPGTEIVDSEVGDEAVVTHAWVRGARIGAGSDCGPFSKLRPGTELAPGVHVGSFAEMTRTRIGRGSKVPHFSYLGDTTVGEDVNVAAGTITANWDGVRKNPTVIEDGVFVGVDTMMVAPVTVGRGSRTGAGSVVTRDVPPGATAVGVPARVVRRRPTDDKPAGARPESEPAGARPESEERKDD
jgi:bifunctional UDP-N-acetylglucosamine pyrophosphorylase/glucosamine-1-phosphate N-acetyltransferase